MPILIKKKKVRLDSLKVNGTHVENYIYSTQMSKFIPITAKIRLKKTKKSIETARNFFLLLLKKHCLSLHPGF